ncbi:MAG: hypothetical protein IJN16_00440 [Lachnospiraceae bacterium]|nr:hypothetical protein [Lachnospiraceae bacterium]
MNHKQKEVLAEYFAAPKPVKKGAFVRQFGLPHMNLWHVIVMQAKYVSKWVWICSILLFGAAFGVAQIAEQRYVSVVLGFVPFLVMFSVTESTRSYRHGMEELEMSARFSLKSIVMARMVVLGMGNLVVLTGVTLVLSSQVQLHPVYLLTPYFLSASGGLYIVRKVRGKESSMLCFALAAFVSIFMLLLSWERCSIYLSQNIWIWACACVAGVIMTIREGLCTIRMTEELA